MGEQPKKKCFVIMPFSGTINKHTEQYWSDHYNYLKDIIESHHLTVHRSTALRGDLLRQIITDLVTVPIVVADLTDLNANVFWELGVRQSFRHGTITIREYDGKELPFDIAVKATLPYYPDDHIKMKDFEEQFHKAITDCLNNPSSPDSHVLETISGRGTLFQIIAKEEILRKLDALLAEFEYNSNLLDIVTANCEENAIRRKARTTQVQLTPARYRVMSAELLAVNRYVDAEKSFYSALDDYLILALGNNGQLSCWWQDEEGIEHWLESQHDLWKGNLDRIRKLVAEQKDKILALL